MSPSENTDRAQEKRLLHSEGSHMETREEVKEKSKKEAASFPEDPLNDLANDKAVYKLAAADEPREDDQPPPDDDPLKAKAQALLDLVNDTAQSECPSTMGE